MLITLRIANINQLLTYTNIKIIPEPIFSMYSFDSNPLSSKKLLRGWSSWISLYCPLIQVNTEGNHFSIKRKSNWIKFKITYSTFWATPGTEIEIIVLIIMKDISSKYIQTNWINAETKKLAQLFLNMMILPSFRISETKRLMPVSCIGMVFWSVEF